MRIELKPGLTHARVPWLHDAKKSAWNKNHCLYLSLKGPIRRPNWLRARPIDEEYVSWPSSMSRKFCPNESVPEAGHRSERFIGLPIRTSEVVRLVQKKWHAEWVGLKHEASRGCQDQHLQSWDPVSWCGAMPPSVSEAQGALPSLIRLDRNIDYEPIGWPIEDKFLYRNDSSRQTTWWNWFDNEYNSIDPELCLGFAWRKRSPACQSGGPCEDGLRWPSVPRSQITKNICNLV